MLTLLRGNFTFKCHRDDQKTKVDVYSINTVQIFPVDRTIFATAGSDGIFNFWDKDKRRRLSTFPAAGGAITSTAFNHDGSLFAYAVGYDWSKGYSSNTPQYPTKVMIHPMKEAELKK